MELTIHPNLFYIFNCITRYSSRLPPSVCKENDSEHSFMIAVIILRLADKYKYTNPDIVKHALLHDIGELTTGDINARFKTPELKRVLADIEKPFIDKVYKYFNLPEPSHTDELLIKVADFLCVKFYGNVNQNKQLANEGYRMFKIALKKFLNEINWKEKKWRVENRFY